MAPFRIILADYHRMFRHGIRRILEDVEGIIIVGEADDGLKLLKLLRNTTADLLVLDISMPGMRGIEASKEIKSLYPEIKILILTMHRDLEYFQHAIDAGAVGFLLKEDADEALVTAIKAIQRGEVFISPLLKEDLTYHFFQQPGKEKEGQVKRLTTREKEVLKLIAEGKTSREIADLFSISVRTVQHHRANLMKKLSLRKTADLVKFAIRRGYTDT